MNSIVTISNRDRGFAKLGPEADPIYRALRKLLSECGYEHELQGSDIWVRYANLCNDSFPNRYARIVNVFTSSQGVPNDFGWLHDLDRRYDGIGQTASADDCRKLFQKAAADPHYKFLHWLDASLMLCRRDQRRDFIAEVFLPAFMSRFPKGRIVFIGTNYDLDKRLPLLRYGNFYQINGRQAIDDMRSHNVNSPATASALHLSGVLALDNALTVLLANLIPLRTHVVGGTIQLRVVYLFGEDTPSVIDRGPHPREEIELQRPQFFLRGDDPADFAASPSDALGAWSGRYRNGTYPGDEEAVDLIAFFLDRFNLHAENRLEVCNFTDNDQIDFISAFEKYLTIDRILLECLMIATATDPATSRLMTFAILDKFQELCRFLGVQQNRNFHYMCTRQFLANVLVPSFAQMPPAWRDFFTKTATDLYDDLYAAVESDRGVWPSHLVQPNGVHVYRNYDNNTHKFVPRANPYDLDEFVGEYVRAARNTHHGYISDNDKRRRFACIGSLSTAFIPDSFTQLPLLIAVAEFINPTVLSGHHWLDPSSIQCA